MKRAFTLVLILVLFVTGAIAQIVKDGKYYIVSRCNLDYALDLNSSRVASGNNIRLWEYNGTEAQNWYFSDVFLDAMIDAMMM